MDKNESVTFAIIGTIYPLKQQKLFVDAVELLNKQQQEENRYWIIGKIADQKYAQKVLEQIEDKPYIQYLGEKSQKELSALYDKIDVIVVCSKQESLPIVVVEALMRQKICIVCDNTGISKYITNKENGYIYKTNAIDELVKVMQYVLNNKNSFKKVGKNARKIYEEKFSVQQFKIRVRKESEKLKITNGVEI